MKWGFIPERINYDGSQLGSHFAYKRLSIVGDSIVGFVGSCDVNPEFMVDVEDLTHRSTIASRQMLHFIAEHFEIGLDNAILRQRLLICILQHEVNRRLRGRDSERLVERIGDDLFVGDQKLTVSVATKSPVSCLIHLGVNINAQGAPVEAIGLSELISRQELEVLAMEVMNQYVGEDESVRKAVALVRGVREYRGLQD